MRAEIMQRVDESQSRYTSLKNSVDSVEETNKQVLKAVQQKATQAVSNGDTELSSGARQKTANRNQASVPEKQATTKADNDAQHRKVLIVGDSTIKSIDKRSLLRQETVSKCRAATILEAHEKIRTGSTHELEKVIFCVGLNDLRNGVEVRHIVNDMKRLIEETLYQHPRCYVYLCSILPARGPDITRDKISSLNLELEQLQKTWERVFYVNTISAFLRHDTPHELFEKDGVHPSRKGSLLMMATIRKKIESQLATYRQFTSKRATPNTFSYAGVVSHQPTVEKASGTPPASTYYPKGTDPRSTRDAGTSLIHQEDRQRSYTPHVYEPPPPQRLADTVYSSVGNTRHVEPVRTPRFRDNGMQMGRGPRDHLYYMYNPTNYLPAFHETGQYPLRGPSYPMWQDQGVYYPVRSHDSHHRQCEIPNMLHDTWF
jgi:lysophospholipase L1-like esterase